MKIKIIYKLLYKYFWKKLNKVVQNSFEGYYQFEIYSIEFNFILGCCFIEYAIFHEEDSKITGQITGEFHWDYNQSVLFNLGSFSTFLDQKDFTNGLTTKGK